MNRDRFSTYLKQPETMNFESLSDLRQIVSDYPYFSAGRIMLLRNLNMTNDSDYDKELPFTAIYAGSRSVLYNYVFSQAPKASEPEIAQQPEKSIVINKIAEHETNVDVSGEKEEIPLIEVPEVEAETEVKEAITTPVTETEIQVPKVIKESAVHSFASWLEIMSQKGVVQQKPAPANRKQWDLIDNFIQESPKLSQANPDTPRSKASNNLADDSAEHHEEFMTETLAKIYIKQKHFHKAIQIFKKLSLKYPEKSIYFAGQIKIVEQLLKNEKE